MGRKRHAIHAGCSAGTSMAVLRGAFRIQGRRRPSRHLPGVFGGRDGLHLRMLCLGFKAMLVAEMFSEPVGTAIGLATEPADEIEDVLGVVVAQQAVNGLVFGHTITPLSILPATLTARGWRHRPAVARVV